MRVSTLRTVQHMWLPLLMVFVLCASVTNSVCWAETQQQEIELESEYVPDSSEDDKLITGFMPGLSANRFQSFSSLVLTERLLTVTDSDAYSSFILHGPPATHHPV
jgi:hypothetical protein